MEAEGLVRRDQGLRSRRGIGGVVGCHNAVQALFELNPLHPLSQSQTFDRFTAIITSSLTWNIRYLTSTKHSVDSYGAFRELMEKNL